MLMRIVSMFGQRNDEVRENPGRCDYLDYDNDNDNDNATGARGAPVAAGPFDRLRVPCRRQA